MEVNPKTTEDIMTWVKSAAEKGGEFLEREAPLYVSEMLAWYFWSSVFFVILFLVLAISCWIIFWVICKCYRSTEDGEGAIAFFAIGVFLAGVAFLGGSFNSLYCAIKVSVAPRVVLMEQLNSTIRGK